MQLINVLSHTFWVKNKYISSIKTKKFSDKILIDLNSKSTCNSLFSI